MLSSYLCVDLAVSALRKKRSFATGHRPAQVTDLPFVMLPVPLPLPLQCPPVYGCVSQTGMFSSLPAARHIAVFATNMASHSPSCNQLRRLRGTLPKSDIHRSSKAEELSKLDSSCLECRRYLWSHRLRCKGLHGHRSCELGVTRGLLWPSQRDARHLNCSEEPSPSCPKVLRTVVI